MALFDGAPVLGRALAVNANSAADTFIPIPNAGGKVYVAKVFVTNASATLASTTAELGVYTQISKGGTAVVTGATSTLTSNTTSAYVKDCTIASATSALSLTVANAPATVNGAPNGEAGLYVSIAGTPNVAATVDVYVVGYVFGN